jgi:hypothetical protein
MENVQVMLTTVNIHQGTAGYMSYQDIEYHLEDGTGTVHYDEEAAVQYLTYAPLPTPLSLSSLVQVR